MGIDFNCPSCGSEIMADESSAGERAQCPKCKGPILIPHKGIRPGIVFCGYRIERKLGVGGMGEVWLAQHITMQRKVALKILFPAMTSDPDFLTRFMNEARTAAKLEHPNVVTAFDAGESDGVHYLAVSYVDGEEMGARLRRLGLIREKEALLVVRGVAEALGYAWNNFRMLHRDVKPANIMLATDGTAKLMDMGISKTLTENANAGAADYIEGTPNYMSPEQARGEQSIDFRADVYSLGATLYHLVTGAVAYSGHSTMAVLTKQMTEPLLSPRKRNPAVSLRCAALVEKMMSKDPQGRHDSWESVVRDIDSVLESVYGSSPQKASHAQRPQTKSKAIPIAAAILVVLAGVIVFFAVRTRKVAPAGVPLASPANTQDTAVEMWNYAVQYARDNPRQYEMAKGHFRTLKGCAAGTKYEMMADVEIKRLEQAQREASSQAAAGVLDGLRERARPLLQSQDYAGAAALFGDYNGPLARETAPEREKLAAEFDKQAKQLAVVRAKANGEAREKVERMMAAAAGDLLDCKTDEALAKAEALSKEGLPAGSEAERFAAVRDLLRRLGQVNEMVLKSFDGQVGREIEVTLDGQVQRLKIVGTKEGVVQAERKVGGAMVGVTFNMRQLSHEERCRRLQGLAAPDLCALCAGILAHSRGADEEAAKVLTGAGIMGPAMQTALNRLQQARKDELAARALTSLLQPLGVSGKEPDWAVVSNRLLTAKLDAKVLSSALKGLDKFKQDYGATAYAAGRKEFTDQLGALLANLCELPELPGSDHSQPPGAATPARMAVRKSSYKTPESLIAAMKAGNSDYNGGGSVKMENGQITYARFLATPGITNIAPLKGLSLNYLNLGGNMDIADYSPIAGMPLRELLLENCKSFDNSCMPLLAPLPLERLNLYSTPVRNISVLKGKRLSVLLVSNIGDLEPLRGMPLEELHVSSSASITDLAPLKGMPLKKLFLSYMAKLSDVAAVGSLVALEEFQLDEAPAEDFACLSKLHALEILDLHKTRIASLSALKKLFALKKLNISNTLVTDLEPLRDKKLEWLACEIANIKNPEDIRALRHMRTLARLSPGKGAGSMPSEEFWKRYDAGEFK